MEFKQLKALQVIAEKGSFSTAAEDLHLTQSALSHQIRHLEDELGEVLLIRARPKVYPTPAGKLVIDSIDRIQGELDLIRQHFPGQRKPPEPGVSGTIRVAATAMGMAYLYGQFFEDYIGRYPGVEVIFRNAETPEEGCRRVLAGNADIAFTPLPVALPDLEIFPLGSSEHVFVAGAGHPALALSDLTPAQLRKWSFVRFAAGTGSRKASDDLFLGAGGYPRIVAESNDVEFIKRLVVTGKGIALVPTFALVQEFRDRTVERIRTATPDIFDSYGFVVREGPQKKPVNLLRNLCGEIGKPDARPASPDVLAFKLRA